MLLDDSDESEGSDELLLDFPPKPRMLTEARRQASWQLAIRRAVTVASASTQSKIRNADMPTRYVEYAREKLELDGCLLDAEMAFLDRMSDMDYEDRVDTLFELFDIDGNDLIEISELDTLIKERMRETNAGNKQMPEVERVIELYDEDEMFDRKTFAYFARNMQKAFNCSNFLDFCFLMAQTVAFNEDTRKIIEGSMKENIQRGKESGGVKADALVEARLILIFAMLDSEGNGVVSFTEIVKHVFRFSYNMDSTKQEILLMYGKSDCRTLDQAEFSELMLNVLAMCDCDIHDLSDAMTLSMARNDVSEEDMRNLMMNPDDLIHKAKNLNNHATRANVANLAYGRLERLFDMLDTDHDGSISTTELSSFLKNYHSDQGSGFSLFSQYDMNDDGRLDFEEFANMIVTFAGKDVDPHKLIDYLCVQVALSDDKPKEEAHVSTMMSLKTIGQRLKDGLTNSNHGGRRSSFTGFAHRGSESSQNGKGERNQFRRSSQGAVQLISQQLR